MNNELSLYTLDQHRLHRFKAFLSSWKGALMVGSVLGPKSETPQT